MKPSFSSRKVPVSWDLHPAPCPAAKRGVLMVRLRVLHQPVIFQDTPPAEACQSGSRAALAWQQRYLPLFPFFFISSIVPDLHFVETCAGVQYLGAGQRAYRLLNMWQGGCKGSGQMKLINGKWRTAAFYVRCPSLICSPLQTSVDQVVKYKLGGLF